MRGRGRAGGRLGRDAPDEDASNPVLGVPVVRPWPFDPLGTRRAAVEAAAALVRADRRQPSRSRIRPAGRRLARGGRPAARRAGPHPPAPLTDRRAARATCRCRSWSSCGATRPSWPGRSVARCRAVRRSPLAVAPGSTSGSSSGGVSNGCSMSTSCPEPPTTPQIPTPTCWLCRRRSRRASGGHASPPTSSSRSTSSSTGCCCADDATPSSPTPTAWSTSSTGRPVKPKSGTDATVAAVQLAVYRLAWHHLSGVPLDRIRASFHYVGANRTVRPDELLSHDELVALVRSVPIVQPTAPATTRLAQLVSRLSSGCSWWPARPR